MLEEYLIECCSPTLASIKTANLFNYPFSSETELYSQLARWNGILGGKGVSITVLRQREHTALIYVYRRARLKNDLQNNEVRELLADCGYPKYDIDSAIDSLRTRLRESRTFPHEIGVFLGYPVGDVKGFICNGGRNCKCEGCWKVYCDRPEAERTFARYKECSRSYARMWSNGRSVRDLTVMV